MPVGPNAPAHDSAPIYQSPEADMSTAPDIEADGVSDVRVDCNCSRYSAETVYIPHRVIMEAVADPSIDVKRLHADPRIYSTTIARKTPARPSRDFKPLHLHQIAATLRARRLIPFSPFTRNAAGLRLLADYAEWVAKWEATNAGFPEAPEPSPVLGVASFLAQASHVAATPTDDVAARLDTGTPLERQEVPGPSELIDSLAGPSPEVLDVIAGIADAPPTLDELGGGYTTKLPAVAVLRWVNADPALVAARARYALDRELERSGKGPRSSVLPELLTLLEGNKP